MQVQKPRRRLPLEQPVVRREETTEPVPPKRELTFEGLLRLRQQLGNARLTRMLQRATARRLLRASVGWPAAKAINAGQKVSGAFTRFPIGAMTTALPPGSYPEEAKAKSFTTEEPFQRAIVLVPTSLVSKPPGDIDVFFLLHGFNIGWREGSTTSPDGFAYKDRVRDEEDDEIAAGLPSTMAAVLPQGSATSRFGSISTDALIKEALGAVPGWGSVKPRRVVFGAHSGGGAKTSELLGSSRKTAADRQAEPKARVPGLSAVTLFDAINGPNELTAAISWVNDHVDEDLAALESKSASDQDTYLESSMRFRAFYSAGSPTYQPLHEQLKAQTIAGKLPAKKPAKRKAITQKAWDQLRENYKIEPRGQSHKKKLAGGNLAGALSGLRPGAAPSYPVSPPSPKPLPDGTLKQGMVGPEVQDLQQQLNHVAPTVVAATEVDRGELTVARAVEPERAHRDRRAAPQPEEPAEFPLVDDGKFGPRTRAGVRAYQRSRGLVVDGIAGPKTRRTLLAETLAITGSNEGERSPPPEPA